ncbi:MAG: LysM peptidoglycan-binding domain-containing protein [Butyrivibrio sp.]|nr:LysM peptidoglycan-binding domain-containing protein [Butyrivibrio sp.]
MDTAYMTYREIAIIKNKKRRERIVARQRLILFAVAAVLLFLFIFVGAVLMLEAKTGDVSYKYYRQITVHSGDTLCSIAGEYITDDYRNIEEYVAEVMSINHLEDADCIYAGESLIVPYYSREFF